MTIEELLSALTGVSKKLDSEPDDESKFALNMLVLQLRQQLVAEAFDPLTDLAAVAGVDVRPLESLLLQVDQAIVTEQKRVQLVHRIVSLANIALRSAGVTLPG